MMITTIAITTTMYRKIFTIPKLQGKILIHGTIKLTKTQQRSILNG